MRLCSMLVAVGLVLALVPAASPRADQALERAQHRVHGLKERIRARRASLATVVGKLDRLRIAAGLMEAAIPDVEIQQPLLGVLELRRSWLLHRLRARRREAHRARAWHRKLLAFLRGRKDEAVADLARLMPLSRCPVAGPKVVTDSFGAPRKGRTHQGDDIMAAYGTPIVAPFAGRVVAAHNGLGGLAVKVYGELGYVYNAHLSRVGALGAVEPGAVIGYVGVSGNAVGPHLHFEWHPGNGAAVDPYDVLTLVC
jgi:murein DD-endopeptidase MepM/ murein hydrolase activator NlpD